MKIRFIDHEHKDFFMSMMAETKNQDCYHQALFYTLGLNPDTRVNIRSLFDFKEDGIQPEHFYAPWQTGGSYRVTRLAFNLWNGWTEPGRETDSTPMRCLTVGMHRIFLKPSSSATRNTA